MAGRFAFVYFMKRMPDRIREVVPLHIDYWKTRRLQGYRGGPFADRTGGLITFEAASLESATKLVDDDPFVVHDLLETKWVKEWSAE